MNESNKRVEYSSKQRKIHKLKRENVVLGQQRISYIKSFEMQGYMKDDGTFWVTKPFRHFYLEDVLHLNTLSFKIGKNSAKIQRLRTLIQQEKKVNEHSNCA